MRYCKCVFFFNAIEGYGVYKVDSRGYVNEDKTLGDEYVLCVGASFTQGKEVIMHLFRENTIPMRMVIVL